MFVLRVLFAFGFILTSFFSGIFHFYFYIIIYTDPSTHLYFHTDNLLRFCFFVGLYGLVYGIKTTCCLCIIFIFSIM